MVVGVVNWGHLLVIALLFKLQICMIYLPLRLCLGILQSIMFASLTKNFHDDTF